MIYPPTPENIKRAATLLQAGELVAFPTETVYGLGAHACADAAVKKIYALKGRPPENPLIVHVASLHDLSTIADIRGHESTIEKLKRFIPGPLTLVLPRQATVSALVSAGLNTVGVRVPSHPIALQLLQAAALPVAAPSANPSTYISPTRAEHVESAFGTKAPFILDGGECRVGLESTVISLVESTPVILRHGAVTQEDLESLLGRVNVRQLHNPSAQTAAPSPGMQAEHYAPRTPLKLLSAAVGMKLPEKTGCIVFSRSPLPHTFSVVRELSPSGDLQEISRRLFAALHEMDQLDLDLILVDTCEEKGLGRAIMDRILRAAAKHKH